MCIDTYYFFVLRKDLFMIKREHIYLGIKNNQGVIAPLVGMHDQDKIRNLENGELLNTTGTVYGAIEGFPSCSLDQILEAWHFQNELTEEEIHMITTIFQYPELVMREMKRIDTDLLDQDDLWMMEHVYIMIENTKPRKKSITEIEREREMLYNCREHILQQLVTPKQKRKEWR